MTFLGRAFFVGIGMQNIMETSKFDAWLVMILGFVLGFIPILFIAYMNKKNIHLLDLINELFGKVIGKIISIVIIICLTICLITITNDFINFANVKYLFETPNLFITLLFIIPAFYISHKGAEAIGRTALFMFYISSLLFILNSGALIKLIEIDNLKPVLASGISPVIKGSLYFIIYSIIPIIFLGIIPKNHESYKKYNKGLIIGYIVSSLSTIIITFFVMTIFNYEYISLFNYPAYFTLKKIEYGFIANVENIMSFYFIIEYFFSVLILLYSILYFLEKSLNLKNNKLKISSVIVTLMIAIVSNYIFKNTTIAIIFSKSAYIIINSIFLIIFIILFTIKIKLNHHN